MPTKALAKTKPTPPALVKTEVKGTRLVTPLQNAVEELTIETAEDYQTADEILTGIQQARKSWASEMEGTDKEPGPLRAARIMKQSVDALNRKIDGPLATLETQVKAKMREWKLEDARRIAAEQERIAAEQAKLTAKIEETANKELAARTAQMRERLAERRRQLEAEAEEKAAEVPEETKGEHSTVRRVRKWRIADQEAVLRGVIQGHIPQSVVMTDNAAVNKQWLLDPDVVASWPGFEVYEDIQIAGRGR